MILNKLSGIFNRTERIKYFDSISLLQVYLTLFQTTNFRFFKTERVCIRQLKNE